jgi:hypothetical protein
MMVECAANRGTGFMEEIQARLNAYARRELADDVSGALIEFTGQRAYG